MRSISRPSRLLARTVLRHCTSLYSYTAVAVVSAHPMSTTRELRRPAAIVLRTGALERDMVGGWKELKSVLRVVARRGSGNSGGRMRRRRRDEEPVTRYLDHNISLKSSTSHLMRHGL